MFSEKSEGFADVLRVCVMCLLGLKDAQPAVVKMCKEDNNCAHLNLYRELLTNLPLTAGSSAEKICHVL